MPERKFPKKFLEIRSASGLPSSQATRREKSGWVQPAMSPPLSATESAIMEEAEDIATLSLFNQEAVRKLPFGSPERAELLGTLLTVREPTYNELVQMIGLPSSVLKRKLSKYQPGVQEKIIKKLESLVEQYQEPVDPEHPSPQEILALTEFPLSEIKQKIQKYLPAIQEDILAMMEYYKESPEDIPLWTEKSPGLRTKPLGLEEAKIITGEYRASPQKKFFTRMLGAAQSDLDSFMALMVKKYGERRKGYAQIIPDSAEALLANELAYRVNKLKAIGCQLNVDKEGNLIELVDPEICSSVVSASTHIQRKASANPKHFGRGSAPSARLV
jgi:hypothetical protein